MKTRSTLNELKMWIKDNTNDKNDCLKNLYFDNKKVIKIKYECSDYDVFIFQTEDGCLSYEEYSYVLGGEDKTDFYAEKERWRAKKYEEFYYVGLIKSKGVFEIFKTFEQFLGVDDNMYLSGNCFQTEQQAQKFADDLNKAIAPLFEKAKNGEYDEED